MRVLILDLLRELDSGWKEELNWKSKGLLWLLLVLRKSKNLKKGSMIIKNIFLSGR